MRILGKTYSDAIDELNKLLGENYKDYDTALFCEFLVSSRYIFGSESNFVLCDMEDDKFFDLASNFLYFE